MGVIGVVACARDRRSHQCRVPLLSDGRCLGEKVTLYFLDGVGDLPYVELKDWMDLLNMIFGDKDDEAGYHLSLDAEGPVATYTRENGCTMVIDFERTSSGSRTTACS